MNLDLLLSEISIYKPFFLLEESTKDKIVRAADPEEDEDIEEDEDYDDEDYEDNEDDEDYDEDDEEEEEEYKLEA
jgi:hypothetical protein